MKPRLVADILDSAALQASGIQSLGAAQHLRIGDALPQHRDVLIVVPDILPWLDQADWQTLLAHAARQETHLRIYTSAVDHERSDAISARVRSDWAKPRGASGTPGGRKSAVAVLDHPGSGSLYLYRSGDVAWIAFDSPFGSYVPGTALGMRIERSKSDVWEWIEDVEARFATSCKQLTVAGYEESVRSMIQAIPGQTSTVSGGS